jgi:hypothetical protein
MRRRATVVILIGIAAAGVAASLRAQAPATSAAPQTWSGLLSDSTCGGSHKAMSASAGMTERECAFHCLKALSKYVLVDQNGTVLPIANQDFAGLPLRLARPVRVTGQMTDNGIVISRIEPPLVHAHIGHVMTAWRDTPGTVGLLTVAASDTRVAAAHALLASKSETLDEMKTHAGHVLHALEPTIEPKGPASGYGAKKATAGGLQHVGFAASVEDASPVVKAHAAVVSSKLTDTIAAIDRAIATAQKIRAAAASGEALSLIGELVSQISQVSEGVESAQQEMRLMMKAEGL